MPDKTGLATGVRVNSAQRHFRLMQFNGRNRPWVNDGENVADAGVQRWQAVIVNTVLATNVVTITTASTHGFAVGATVKISTANNGNSYNGRYVIASAPSSTTFTYARTATNVATANNGGFVTLVPTIAASGTGFTGTYRYFVAPVNKNRPLPRGRFVAGPPSEISAELTVKNQGVAISGIPASHADSAVTHWALYRNQNGNYDSFAGDETQDFWLIDYIAIGTTTYTDTAKDKDLPPIAVDFRTERTPTFKTAVVSGGRLIGAGFDPLTTGTATVNANTVLIDFASVTLPDGVTGCLFRKDGDDNEYEIRELVTNQQVALDRPFSGALSTASYSIYRNNAELWPSEYNNFDATGLPGETRRNRLPVGGPGSDEPVTAIARLGETVFAFTARDIYRVDVTSAGPDGIRVGKNPFVSGIGCVGFDAVWQEGGILYFLSFLGPMAFEGQSRPVSIGAKIGLDWLTSLAPDQLASACVGSDGRKVKFAVPETGETENGLVWVYDIETKTWWQEKYIHPRFYFRDKDSNGEDALFYAQGKFIFQDEKGTNDGVPSGDTTGTVTTGTSTTSVTCSGETFYTTGSGLEERYVHFFRAGAFVGSRRLSSNTATALTWSATGAGGGNLTVAVGDIAYLGPVYWYWQTKNYSLPNRVKRNSDMHLRFDLQGEATASTLIKSDFVDNVEATSDHEVTVDRASKVMPISKRNIEYAVKLESRLPDADISIRSLAVASYPDEPDK